MSVSTTTTTQNQNTITQGGYTPEAVDALHGKLNELNQQMGQYETKLKSDDELRQRATNELTPGYNASVEEQNARKASAQNAYEQQVGALDRQLDRTNRAVNQAYDTQYANAGNEMLARGMSSSSLASALLNQVNSKRNQALADAAAERDATAAGLAGEYQNQVQAAENAIARLKSDLQTNILNRYDALKDQDYERAQAAKSAQNSLLLNQQSLLLQLEELRRAALDANKNVTTTTTQTVNEDNGRSGSSGRSSASYGAGGAASPASEPGNAGSSYLASLYNGGIKSSVSGGLSSAAKSDKSAQRDKKTGSGSGVTDSVPKNKPGKLVSTIAK